MRIALGLEYDGAPFKGWQDPARRGHRADALEAALAAIAGVPVRAQCAGRTDTGVHALIQVVHFYTHVDRPDSAWVKGVNTHLHVPSPCAGPCVCRMISTRAFRPSAATTNTCW